MFYIINNDKVEKITEEDINKDNTIAIFTNEEWEKKAELRSQCHLNQKHDSIHFCKIESYFDYLFGTYRMPIKKKYGKNIEFAFYILNKKLIIIDNTKVVENFIEKISSAKLKKNYSIERFLYDLMSSLISDDLIYLENIEKKLAAIEEEVLKGNMDKFNGKILPLKKEILKLHRYYSHLIQFGDELVENEMDMFDDNESSIFRILSERSSRLQSETQILREYAAQVQEVYESEIGIHQNDIMKVLTIVTTVFLPLTLIVGWYGMNFANMPELRWVYGYPVVIAASIFIVVLSLWYFKKKKFW